jgi:hypothetical protein
MKKLALLACSILLIACSHTTRFKLLNPSHTGIDFNNLVVESDSFHILSYEYIYNGAGVGVGDLNNDGLQDLVFAGNQVSPKIYLNLGDFRFKDITPNFRGLSNDQWYSGVSITDINNDGWPDVYLTSTADTLNIKCINRLWVNEGGNDPQGPMFTEMAEKYGIDNNDQSVSAAFLDYDLDGDLDLYILNNTLTKRMNTNYRVKITDGSAGNNDKLYRNNGDGTFTNVTVEAGIVYEGFGLGLAIGDVNKDGYPDIYVSNDYISNDLLYINQGDGTFLNEISKYMSYQTKSSMGDDMADINNDGNPDMFTLDMLPEEYYKKKQTINGFSYRFYLNDAKYGFEHQYLRNMLHVHNGFLNGEMLPYSELGQMAGIYATEWSWSPLFADYDNDGDKDLIVANGYPKDMTDKDWTRYQASVYGFVADAQHVIDMAPAIKVPNMAFENKGNLSFEKTSDWLPGVPSYSYGASFVDLDNDGDLDYVANNLDDKAFVLRNYTVERSGKKAGFIRVKLTGTRENRMAIGAKIELWSNGHYQFAEHFLTRGYASSVDPVVHFGLSSDVLVDSIKVTWPSGRKVSVLKNLSANQTVEINEDESGRPVRITGNRSVRGLLFSKAEGLIDYTHQQSDFVDFFMNQSIIPHKFSQIGPAIAKGDINNDGKDDIIIGSTNELPTTAFIREGSRFVKSEFDGLTTLKNCSESDLAVLDIDNDGDNDVIACAGGYENQNEGDYRHFLYLNNGDHFERISLPVPGFPASIIRPLDFDHDGDIDLFIGSRITKGMFPYADKSWLIINEKGHLSVSDWSGFDLGMVTDAIWSDYDGDGWEDLIIAREWNSLIILKNLDGKQLVPQNLPDLEDHHGLWYSLVSGDFDQDGDDDYIAGNLGDNHRFTVSGSYPLNLYAVDLDLDGNIDPVTTGYWRDQNGVMKEYPVNYLDELWSQSTFFQRMFKDYKTFSLADINDIFNDEIRKRIGLKLYVNTTSSFVIWNDNGKFTWQKLPPQAQTSPLRKMLVKDLNHDHYPEILAAGNDYTWDIATGYFDANKGIILSPDGKGRNFEVLEPPQSGFFLKGMVESMLFIEGDTLLVIAGINRDKIAVLQGMGN